MISYVPPDFLPDIWNEVEGFIKSAIEHSCGESQIQDIYKKIEEQKMGLIVVEDEGIIAAAVVEFMNYPQITALRVAYLGGLRMTDWLGELVEFLDKWALENGMNRVEQMGRHGWVKVLEKYGYRKRYVFMTKELDNG